MDPTSSSSSFPSSIAAPSRGERDTSIGGVHRLVPKRAGPRLRRRLATLLLVIAGLVLANVALVVQMSSRIRAGAEALSEHAELYKLSRRIQVSIESVAPEGPRSLERFRQGADEFDRDLETHAALLAAIDLDQSGDAQLPLLVEGLVNDWKNFNEVYSKLRHHDDPARPTDLISALDRNANELQASVIAISFTLQRIQERQLGTLKTAIFAIAAADFVVLGLIMVWLRRYVVNPVERISIAAHRFANADFDARVGGNADEDRADEIVHLGHLFNHSADRVQDILRDIRQESAALREIEASFHVLCDPSRNGTFVIQDDSLTCVTPRFAEIFGVSVEAVMRDAHLLPLLHPDDRRNARMRLGHLIDGELREVQFDLRGIKSDGSTVHIRIFAATSSFGDRPAIVGTLVELNDRQRTEEELQRIGRSLHALSHEKPHC